MQQKDNEINQLKLLQILLKFTLDKIIVVSQIVETEKIIIEDNIIVCRTYKPKNNTRV
jgi:hypothetical protein